jgi:hypothetical protein
MATVNQFDQMMEREFMPAAGIRRSCGARPFIGALRYRGAKGRQRYNQDYDAYMKCVNELRQMNMSQGLPADTGIVNPPAMSDQTTQITDYQQQSTSSNAGMSDTTKYWIIGGMAVGAALAVYGIVRAVKASKGAPNTASAS